jgi:phage-related protein
MVINLNNVANDTELIIHAQTITNNLVCGNTIVKVKDYKTFISVINFSEHDIEAENPQLQQLSYETFEENKQCLITNLEPLSNPSSQRLSQLREIMQI